MHLKGISRNSDHLQYISSAMWLQVTVKFHTLGTLIYNKTTVAGQFPSSQFIFACAGTLDFYIFSLLYEVVVSFSCGSYIVAQVNKRAVKDHKNALTSLNCNLSSIPLHYNTVKHNKKAFNIACR